MWTQEEDIRIPSSPRESGRLWYAYLIGDVENNWYKIGISRGPRCRVEEMKTGAPISVRPKLGTVKLLVSFGLGDHTDSIAREVEKALHEQYARRRYEGEWFRFIDPKDFSSAVKLHHSRIVLHKNLS